MSAGRVWSCVSFPIFVGKIKLFLWLWAFPTCFLTCCSKCEAGDSPGKNCVQLLGKVPHDRWGRSVFSWDWAQQQMQQQHSVCGKFPPKRVVTNECWFLFWQKCRKPNLPNNGGRRESDHWKIGIHDAGNPSMPVQSKALSFCYFYSSHFFIPPPRFFFSALLLFDALILVFLAL